MPYKHRDAWHRQMREYLERRRATLSKESLEEYRGILEGAGGRLGWPPPSRVTVAMLERYEASLSPNPNTRRTYCSVLKRFLMQSGCPEAARWGPVAVARPKLDGVFLEEATVEYVRQVARGLGPEHELLYSLAVDNGCRVIDMRRMTVANARELLSSGVSMIVSKGRGGGKPRPLVLNQQTFEPLARYLRARMPAPGGLLFGGISKSTVRRRFRSLSEKAQVYFEPHDLRRTFGHRHWRAGTPIETIAKLMGHESVDQTFRAYIGVQMDDMLAAQRRLCPPQLSQLPRGP